MKIISNKAALEKELASDWRAGNTIAFVPTMGNLHEGHLSLVRAAKARGDTVVVSIFVNPSQFAPHEDYDTYPRTLAADCEALADIGGVAIVFTPDVSLMYPLGAAEDVRIHLSALEHALCGVSRPHFFSGVATVVAKLFHLIRPQVAFFGEKDFQQLTIIHQLVAALHFPIEIVGVPTVREADGLAMSSRNQYLSVAERALAPQFYAALKTVVDRLGVCENTVGDLLAEAKDDLTAAGFAVDYVELRYADDLSVVDDLRDGARLVILGAVRLGSTRLIDNVQFCLASHRFT